MRFSSTYETPDGVRTLSSSTRKSALGILDQVDAGDVDVDAARRGDPLHLRQVARGPLDDLARDDALGEAASLAVDVGQEGFEGLDALLRPGSKGPILGRDDAGNQVEGEDALDARASSE